MHILLISGLLVAVCVFFPLVIIPILVGKFIQWQDEQVRRVMLVKRNKDGSLKKLDYKVANFSGGRNSIN